MIRKIIAIILVQVFILNYGFGYWKPNHRPLAYGFAFSQEILLLEPLLKEARENNPDILASKKRWEAAKARIPQAKSWEDPSIGFTFEKAKGSPFQLRKTMPEDRMLTLNQAIPAFGKLSLKGKIALVESQMLAAEYKQKELAVVSAVKNAYYDLFMNNKEVELNGQSLILLKSITKAAEAKYAVGEMTQEGLFKLNLEVARLSNIIINLREEKKAKETRLSTLINRDPEAILGMPDLSEEAFFNHEIKLLYQATLLNQPELIIFSYAIEKNRHAKSLAKRSFLPDMMTGIVMRGITSGTIGPWDLMLAFTVPLWFWTKQRYEVKEAIANLEEAEAAYRVMQNQAFAEVKDLAVRIEIAKNKINLYKTNLMPILEGSISSSLAAFSSGKGDFMLLLDNQRSLIETKMEYYKALVEYNMNLADLERTVGVDLREVKK